MRVVSAAQMRAIDAAAVARDGEIGLMRRAGLGIARVVPHYARHGAIVGLAGNGNNGGDAFAALAVLDRECPRIAYHDPRIDGSAARVDARERARAAGVELRPYPVDGGVLAGAGLVLEGLLGVGARLPLDAATIGIVAALAASRAPVVALDVATGCDPTTGALAETHVSAVATVALGRPKLGSLLEPGRDAAGDLWCVPLGMRDADGDGIDVDAHTLTPSEFAALLPKRAPDAEKRSAGAPLIVAGSEQFPGAAVLCALGAARAGAGYVTVATPRAAAAALRAHLIEQVVVTYDDTDPDGALETIVDLTGRCSSIGIGPGLGLTDALGRIVRGLLTTTSLPVVADASAFFHLTKHLGELSEKPLVLTPHEGEFGRLSGGGTVAPGSRFARLRDFVARYGITTLLKGRTTLVADRNAVHLNPTGTSALATAGTGDVLTGMIATLLAQGLSPVDAARAAAYWHGRAGQLAAAERPVGVIAGDVAAMLGRAARVEIEDDPLRLF